MDLLIIMKWTTNYSVMVGATPPSVITMMIEMFLNWGVADGPATPLFFYQTMIMRSLLVISLICVPFMLYVKPIVLYIRMGQHDKKHHSHSPIKTEEEGLLPRHAINDGDDDYTEGSQYRKDQDSDSKIKHMPVGAKAKPHSFSDIFIHQLIETIEFVLGTVSNTASYLRLWALSLAHSQLAKVFFDNTVKAGLMAGSFLQLFFGFFAFITFTIAVLMMMDLMEAFLHTLRLHWVEF
jgi:V-type H+-transporting ATPase subunit a